MKNALKHPCSRREKPLALALQLSFCILHFTLYTPHAHAAVPVAWTNSPGMPPYPIKPVPHGSTVDLAVTLKGYTTPPIADGADVRMWFQTNGMGQAWWSAPATFDGSTITASFGPAQDCGADRVSLFFGAPSNVFAAAVLRLTHAPGFAPASLPPPPGVAMQPWVAEQLTTLAVAATNYTDQALIDTIKLSEFKPEENPRLVFWDSLATWEDPRLAHPTEFRVSDIVPGNYEVVSNAALTAGPAATNYTDSATNALGSVLRDTIAESTPGNYETVSNRAMRISLPDDDGHPGGVFSPYFNGLAKEATGARDLTKPGQSPDPGKLTLNHREQEVGDGAVTGVWWPAFLDAWNAWHWVASEDYVDEAINNIDIPSPPDLTPYATKTELGSVSDTANAAALDAASALRIVLGESVWFAVTNYMRTAEGVIPSLQLWEVRDSVTNLVYDSREEITNTVKALTRELHTELTNRIHDAEKTIPSKAWGNYQSDGTDNPEPGKVAIVNQPTVILTGGGTFNKYVEIGDSSIWVLTSSGPVSFGGGGTNGNYFAVLDDEGNAHFKVSKTDSFDVGAIFTDNPRTSGDALLLYICSTNRQGEAYIGPPTLSACTNL